MRFLAVFLIASVLPASGAAASSLASLNVAVEAMIVWRSELSSDGPKPENASARIGAQPNSPRAETHLSYGRLQAEIMRHLAVFAPEEKLRTFHRERQARYHFRKPVQAVLVFFPAEFTHETLAEARRRLVRKHSLQAPWSEFIASIDALIGAPAITREVVLFQDKFDRDDLDGEAIMRFALSEWPDAVSPVLDLPSGKAALLIAQSVPPIEAPTWDTLEPQLRKDYARTVFKAELKRRITALSSSPEK